MTSILSVRMSDDERSLVEAAAAASRTSLSDFARRNLIELAEMELLKPKPVIIPAAAWDDFTSWLDAPAKPNEKLERLMASKPIWEN